MNEKGQDQDPSTREADARNNPKAAADGDSSAVKEQTSSSRSANNAGKYEQTRFYAYAYLLSQYLIALIAFGGIAVAICSLKRLNDSVNAASQQAVAAGIQARTTRDEFELSERPWISADPTQISDLTFDKNGFAHFNIRFAVANSGHSPAAHSYLDAQLVPIKFDNKIFTEPLNRQKQLCDPLRTQGREYIDFAAFTLFPNQQSPKDAGMSADPIDIAKATNSKKPGEPSVALFVVGCVDYQFEFQVGHHQTGFVYTLYRTDPRYPLSPFFIHPGSNVPATRLRLERFAIGNGFYAD